MRGRQENQISMFTTVLVACERNIALITPHVGLNNAYLKYKDYCLELNGIALEQLLQIKGEAVQKAKLKHNLAVEMSIVSKLMQDFATDTGNDVLYGAIDYSESEFERMRDGNLQRVAQIIQTNATNYAVALVDYDVTVAVMDDFTTALTKYQAAVAAPTLAMEQRKGATSDLKDIIKEMSNFLRQRLDNAMQVLRKTEPKFFTLYKNARRIYDLHGKTAKNKGILTGVVKGAETMHVLPNALVEIIDTPFMTTTDGNGMYELPLLPDVYSMRVSLDGYTEVEVNDVAIVKGENTVRDFILEVMV